MLKYVLTHSNHARRVLSFRLGPLWFRVGSSHGQRHRTLKQGGAGFRAFGCREGLDKRAKLTESEVLVHVRHFRVFACKGGALIGHCCLDSGCG